MPRVPELGIPKDARVMPVKMELLLIVAPETYVESIKNNCTLVLYMRAELMPLSLDAKAEVVPAPRVVGPVMKYKPTSVLGSRVPMTNAASSSNRPVEIEKGKVAGGEGKSNDPVPSTTRLPLDS